MSDEGTIQFFLEINCIPPDLHDLLDQVILNEDLGIEPFVKGIVPNVDYVGISIPRDVSDYRVGEVIWAKGEFRGPRVVRLVSWSEANQIAEGVCDFLYDFAKAHVNWPDRFFGHDERVPCLHVSAKIEVMGTNHEAYAGREI